MLRDNIMFWLLMCGHLLGDFYFQTQKLVDEKKNSKLSLLKHSIIYAVAISALLIPIINRRILLIILCISVSHLILDFIKLVIIKYTKETNFFNKNVFCLDQIRGI